MRVYEEIIGGLESLGIDNAFGGAGESNTGLMIALKDSDQIRGVFAGLWDHIKRWLTR